MDEKFDAIIIGAGQAGPSLAARMTREGMKTAIIERKLFGGTCVNVGASRPRLWLQARGRRTWRGAAAI
jgi:pyruvate/2-oxoglutarate dehydrogenase complex dihydrolipoamide dehydrogenase (E3) component